MVPLDLQQRNTKYVRTVDVYHRCKCSRKRCLLCSTKLRQASSSEQRPQTVQNVLSAELFRVVVVLLAPLTQRENQGGDVPEQRIRENVLFFSTQNLVNQ